MSELSKAAGDGKAAGAAETADPLERIADAFGDLYVIREAKGRILQANRAFAEATGCADAAGSDLLRFCAPDAAGRRGPSAGSLLLATPKGACAFEWRETTAVDPRTGLLLVHAIGRAETRRPRSERGLIADRERAESANAAKSRFLAMVSHEVRTPLNGILGITKLLAKTRLTREQESYVDAVRHSGHALLALIEDLLDFSSMEAGKFFLRPEAGSLRDTVSGVVELSAHRADEKGIEIAAHVAPEVPEIILADHGRLRQVLFNFIGNALKFTEEGGILVEVAVAGGMVEFRVTDTGPGIGEADRERIFREFEQVESGPTRRKDGAGLGLTISARLVAAMGGETTVESQLGTGSTFIFRIPLADDVAATAAPAVLPASRVLLLGPAGATGTALLRLVRDLGGRAEAVTGEHEVAAALDRLGGCDELTDLVVDHRMAQAAEVVLAALGERTAARIGRTMMVTPAEREALTQARARDYSAWLIRPLRPATLVKVLRRETGGLGAWLEERRTAASDAASRPPTMKRPLKVLLAEDNPVNALLVSSALTRAGHSVVHVVDGHALVERLSVPERGADGFDLVLTDLSMPRMDGIEAIAAIRAFERDHALAPVPVLVLSADGQNATRARALEIGADDYVEKPVDPDVLLQTVDRAAIQAAGVVPGR